MMTTRTHECCCCWSETDARNEDRVGELLRGWDQMRDMNIYLIVSGDSVPLKSLEHNKESCVYFFFLFSSMWMDCRSINFYESIIFQKPKLPSRLNIGSVDSIDPYTRTRPRSGKKVFVADLLGNSICTFQCCVECCTALVWWDGRLH